MSKFMMKLKISGYTREHRWEILKSGTKNYLRKVQDDKDEKISLNRPKWEGGNGRYLTKLMKKTNWYKRRKTGGREEKGGAVGARWKNKDREKGAKSNKFKKKRKKRLEGK